MRNPNQRVIVAVAATICAIVFATLQARGFNPYMSGNGRTLHPPIMLWAWEAPTNLEWLETDRIGVAFLSETITLTDNSIECKPRMQPLAVPDETYRMAVIRIERNVKKPPTLCEHQLDGLVHRVLLHAKDSGVRAIQIDFDARKSERKFYRELLKRLRKELPTATALSMTALASWCIGDQWLKDLSVDEIVPMFFSMGTDRAEVLAHFRRDGSVSHFGKELGIGIADDAELIRAVADGPGKKVLRNSSLFLFSGRAWTQEKARRLIAEIGM